MYKILLSFTLCILVVSFNAQVPNFVPQNGLLGWWPLDNGPADTYTNNLGGTITGAPTPIVGHLGAFNTAYQFNGSDYIQIANNPILSNFNDMSISLWVKTGSGAGVRALVTKWYQVVNCGNMSDTYGVYLTGNQVNYANVNEVWYGFPTPPALSASDLNNWTHIVATSDDVTGQKLYINAVLAASNTSTSLGPICATTGPLMIGAETQQWSPPIQRYFTGALDDIGIWNRVLTLCEIENLYKSSFMYSPSMYGNTAVSISTISIGASTTLSAVAPSLPSPATYQWYKTGSPGVFSTLQNVVVNPSVTTTYTVLAGAVSNCPGSQTITIQPKKNVGISELATSTLIKGIYPNPSNDKISIEVNDTVENVQLLITDVAGRLVLQQVLHQQITEFSIAELKSGLYFVSVQKDDATLCTEKLLKVD